MRSGRRWWIGNMAVLVGLVSGCGVAPGPQPVGCSAGLFDCGGLCVDFANDPRNCGRCGAVCPAATTCQAAACVGANPYPNLGLPGGPVPQNAAVHRIQPGAGTIVRPGQMAGYGITANLGGSYRLVWTGDGTKSGQYREFFGSVFTPGHFSSINPGCGGFCTLQADDKVTAAQAVNGGQRVDFDSVATDTINGFDFVVDAEPVFFDILIDGQRHPELIFFPATDNGGAISNAAEMPFGLTTN